MVGDLLWRIDLASCASNLTLPTLGPVKNFMKTNELNIQEEISNDKKKGMDISTIGNWI